MTGDEESTVPLSAKSSTTPDLIENCPWITVRGDGGLVSSNDHTPLEQIDFTLDASAIADLESIPTTHQSTALKPPASNTRVVTKKDTPLLGSYKQRSYQSSPLALSAQRQQHILKPIEESRKSVGQLPQFTSTKPLPSLHTNPPRTASKQDDFYTAIAMPAPEHSMPTMNDSLNSNNANTAKTSVVDETTRLINSLRATIEKNSRLSPDAQRLMAKASPPKASPLKASPPKASPPKASPSHVTVTSKPYSPRSPVKSSHIGGQDTGRQPLPQVDTNSIRKTSHTLTSQRYAEGQKKLLRELGGLRQTINLACARNRAGGEKLHEDSQLLLEEFSNIRSSVKGTLEVASSLPSSAAKKQPAEKLMDSLDIKKPELDRSRHASLSPARREVQNVRQATPKSHHDPTPAKSNTKSVSRPSASTSPWLFRLAIVILLPPLIYGILLLQAVMTAHHIAPPT